MGFSLARSPALLWLLAARLSSGPFLVVWPFSVCAREPGICISNVCRGLIRFYKPSSTTRRLLSENCFNCRKSLSIQRCYLCTEDFCCDCSSTIDLPFHWRDQPPGRHCDHCDDCDHCDHYARDDYDDYDDCDHCKTVTSAMAMMTVTAVMTVMTVTTAMT